MLNFHWPHDFSEVANLLGLALGMVGVLMLFRWGMPFRLPVGGGTILLIDPVPKDGARKDRLYKVLGWIGLCFILLGWALQTLAILASP